MWPAGGASDPALPLIRLASDAHRDDPLGMCRLDTSSFASMALLMQSLGVPIGAVLEGGYDLLRSRRRAATLEALRDGGAPVSVDVHPLAVEAARTLGRWWPLPVATA